MAERLHMNLNAPRRHSVWLCPEAEIAACLSTEIAKFADLSGTDVFEPHVTLLGDLTCAPQTTIDACSARLGGIEAARAEIAGLTQTNAFYMSLFLDVHLVPNLSEHRLQILRDVGLIANSGFRPHLSLAYGLSPQALTQSDKRALQERFSGLEFDLTHVTIVASARDVPISDWHVLQKLPLSQSKSMNECELAPS
jgi:2'-5' RNA ligase